MPDVAEVKGFMYTGGEGQEEANTFRPRERGREYSAHASIWEFLDLLR